MALGRRGSDHQLCWISATRPGVTSSTSRQPPWAFCTQGAGLTSAPGFSICCSLCPARPVHPSLLRAVPYSDLTLNAMPSDGTFWTSISKTLTSSDLDGVVLIPSQHVSYLPVYHRSPSVRARASRGQGRVASTCLTAISPGPRVVLARVVLSSY